MRSSLRAPEHRVSPRARWFWAVRALVGWLVVAGIEIVVLLTTHESIGAVAALAATAVVAAVHLGVMPQWRFRVHRWESTDTAFYTQTGWFTQERRIAPISRIQTVDTQRGPLEQLFGLSNITVTTASAAGALKVHGLDRATADHLVDELTRRTRFADDDAT